jgi:hypothetical protein
VLNQVIQNKTHKIRFRATILILLVLTLALSPFAHSEVQRHLLIPPFKGQFSEWSEWSIPEQAFVEVTNAYVNEQGLIRTRPGFYCFMDSVSTSKPILGAFNYKRWIEGGAREYIITNTNNKIYYTTAGTGNTNTDISAGVSYSDDGIPVWLIHYNDLYMANGEENPVRWNQSDGNVVRLGYDYFDGSVTFVDTNEVHKGGGDSWEEDPYHFRPGWDFAIADSNNNDGTYEIKEVDGNRMVLVSTTGTTPALTAGADAGGTYTGIGYPPELTQARAGTTLSYSPSWALFANHDYWGSLATIYGVNYDVISIPSPNDWWGKGFRIGETLTVTGTTTYDGDYTIRWLDGGRLFIDANSLSPTAFKYNSTFTMQKTYAVTNAFNPTCVTGHKSRLFVGGCAEYPTYLFFTVSKLLTTQGTYYYDMWRDRVGTVDGSGYIDLQDRIIALIGDWQDALIIGCENRIMRLRGDDPGFDILTPSQSLIYHPDPITLNTGFLGPNSWCEAQGDIFFMSKSGLQQLKIVEQGGTAKYTVLSMPVNDLIDKILEYGNLRRISMKYLKDLNLILINCALTGGDNDSIIAYNLANQTFSKWTFTSTKGPYCLFNAPAIEIDANSTYPTAAPDPYETIWAGSQDGKLWQLTQAYDYDIDMEDANARVNNAFTPTLITAKLNMGDPFLLKNFQRAVFMVRELHNYDNDPNYGSVGFYRKLDNGSWSTVSTRSFTAISGTDGAAIDQYEFLDMYSGIRGTSRTIQYKITTSHKYGLELMGILTEWTPAGYAHWD